MLTEIANMIFWGLLIVVPVSAIEGAIRGHLEFKRRARIGRLWRLGNQAKPIGFNGANRDGPTRESRDDGRSVVIIEGRVD